MPFVQVADVADDMKLVDDTKQKISKMAQPMSVYADKGSVLVTLQGSIGRVAITQYGAFVDRTVLIFDKYNQDIDKTFWAYIIKEKFIDEARKAPGGTIKTITKEALSDFDLMLPNYDEQKKISSFLMSLDNLITLHQRKCEQTKELKKFMLQKMFPKKGEKNPEIRFPGFTDAWEQRKFGELLNETRNKTTVEDEDTLLSCAIDGMFLNSELFSHFRGSSNIGYLKVKKNDLILSAQNLHLGNCNVNLRFEHGIISPAYKVYELIECDPLFMQAWVKQDKTKDFFLKASTEGASVCRKNIIWEELYKQKLPVPKITEQQKIGEYFSNLDRLITLHQRKCEQLKELKKFMLQNMFPKKG
jgi:type I restriction enzyme S subunit